MKKKETNKRIKNEQTQLEEKKQQIINVFQKEINQLEQWTELKTKSIVFDTEICDWNRKTSTFDKHIWNKNNIGILIENEYGIRYGGFIYSTIDKYAIINIETRKWECLNDPKSFLFTFKDNIPMKFELKEDKKNEPIFYLCDCIMDPLFAFGEEYEYEILILKKNIKSWCEQSENSLYDYKGKEKALIGISGKDNKFDIKRFIVIQFN